jgi:thiol-disulfide isomerase/thioredoxin
MKIIHLTGDHEHSNINIIKNHMRTKPCLIFIVAPWCGFCQRLQPTIDTLENELPAESEFKQVSLIKVHDDQLSHIGLKVNSYPTIKMFKQGKAMPNYANEFKREANDIRNYMRKHMNKKNKKSNIKTFKIKKTKSKPKDYRGPGSKDKNWIKKTFGIQHGGNCKCKDCKGLKTKRRSRGMKKTPSLKKQIKSNPWMEEILYKKANGEKLNSYDKSLYASMLTQPLPPGGIKKLLRMYKK